MMQTGFVAGFSFQRLQGGGKQTTGNWVDNHWEDIIEMGFWIRIMNGQSCISKVASS